MLDEIDQREWKSFMEWCGSRAEEFGDWPDKLAVNAYTRYVDEYHEKVLEINEMTRQQVNTVFENVAEIDARYAARMRECQENLAKGDEILTLECVYGGDIKAHTEGNNNGVYMTGRSFLSDDKDEIPDGSIVEFMGLYNRVDENDPKSADNGIMSEYKVELMIVYDNAAEVN